MIEKTLILFKPDSVKRGLVGEILHRYERVGLKIVAAKLVQADAELARKHYPDTEEWKLKVGTNTLNDCQKYGIDIVKNIGTSDPMEVGNLVKQWNIDFLTSGPVLAMVLEGVHAVEKVRSMTGPTVPVLAPAGTIRGDYSIESAIAANRRGRAIYNLIHSSGNVEEAKTEIDLWFKPEEILSYETVTKDLYNY